MALDRSWDSAALAHALCDALVAKGQLKEKPAFIRTDREAKIAGIFEAIGLDGEMMASFENPGPLEMMIRKGTTGEAWVQQVQDALIAMLPEEVGSATKKMGMDDKTKGELEAAKEKTQKRQERMEEQGGEERRPPREDREEGGRDGGKGREGGKGYDRGGGGDRGGDRFGDRGGDKGGGGGRFGDEGGDRSGGGGRFGDSGGDRGGGRFGDSGGGSDRFGGDDRGGKSRGKGDRDQSSMQCFNCQGMGHTSRDCPEPPKPKGGGKGKRDRGAMACNNCGNMGHKGRDCPEPVDEEKLAERLAARKAKNGGDSD